MMAFRSCAKCGALASVWPDMRVAVYYAPERDDPLWAAGCAWLGRDPEADASLAQPDLPDVEMMTSDPRRYGFHATLKPPMRLATDRDRFLADARALADRLAPFPLPRLAVADLSGFLALRETLHCPPLHELANACVEELDEHRAPSPPDELARRRRHGLSPERDAMLMRWGYPDVFATWRFHMTLTRRLLPEEAAIYRPAAEAYFADACALDRVVSAISVYVEAEDGAPFTLAERLTLRG
jgi:putative phosphonate metabolism protein